MKIERMKVGRRAFLALGAGVTGGCIQDSAPGGNETTVPSGDSPTRTDERAERTEITATNRPETDSATTVRGDVTIGIDSEKSEPQATATIGDADLSNDETDTIAVWNDAETARRITISVAKRESDTPLFRETYRFKPDGYVVIGVSNPSKYTVSVGVNGGAPTSSGFKTDDCNIQSLDVTVTPNGSVRAVGTSTMMKCGMI
jgi:hypothetical protein